MDLDELLILGIIISAFMWLIIPSIFWLTVIILLVGFMGGF